MKYFIITGTSRGLGEALVNDLVDTENAVFCISRSKNESLIEKAKVQNTELFYYEYDLSDNEGIQALMKDIFSKIDKDKASAVYLINNAGTVTPIKTIANCKSDEIIRSINVNLTAPILLSSEFVKNTNELAVEKRIINISSGAGKKPYHGWSCYCSGKAGLDLFTKSVAVEEAAKDHPVELMAFAPGIMDTGMQQEIRESDVENFVQLERFKGFKKDGYLLTPKFVAEKVLDLIQSDKFEQGAVVDIKDYMD